MSLSILSPKNSNDKADVKDKKKEDIENFQRSCI